MSSCTAAMGVWTQQALYDRGGTDSNLCPSCSVLGVAVSGTQQHRLLYCPLWDTDRRLHLSPRTAAWARACTAPNL
eukprot:4568552-Amphidinium_carterae.1